MGLLFLVGLFLAVAIIGSAVGGFDSWSSPAVNMVINFMSSYLFIIKLHYYNNVNIIIIMTLRDISKKRVGKLLVLSSFGKLPQFFMWIFGQRKVINESSFIGKSTLEYIFAFVPLWLFP